MRSVLAVCASTGASLPCKQSTRLAANVDAHVSQQLVMIVHVGAQPQRSALTGTHTAHHLSERLGLHVGLGSFWLTLHFLHSIHDDILRFCLSLAWSV